MTCAHCNDGKKIPADFVDSGGRLPIFSCPKCTACISHEVIVNALRTPAQITLEDMARLSASEVACYRWPEDTAEHRAMRAAFCDGAAHTAVARAPGPTVASHDGERP